MRSTREQRAWYWYDWANSAFYTTTATVLISPYLVSLATNAACPGVDSGTCSHPVLLLGVIPVLPGALPSLLATVSTLVSAVVLLFVGAAADRSAHPHRWLGATAWIGAAAGSLMFFLMGSNWEIGAWLMVISLIAFGASIVVYDSMLVRIAGPDERDRVSSRGWAWGYVGGGLLLALNFALVTFYPALGIDKAMAVRLCLLSAGVWWAGFTLVPVLGLRNLPRDVPSEVAGRNPLRQLAATFVEMRRYPQTLAFLLANDGIQTVIVSSSVYAIRELGISENLVLATFLLTQFVAIAGALGFGRIAARVGAKRTVLMGIAIWLVVVVVGFLIPSGVVGALFGLGAAIGVVMGGTQALSRSMYSQLIPLGRESEYFSFYQAMERGTSWLGTLTFALVFQFTESYRLALVALAAFFVVGGILLARVDMRRGIIDAGNALPKVL
jgi:UMF1 family MFS transporter